MARWVGGADGHDRLLLSKCAGELGFVLGQLSSEDVAHHRVDSEPARLGVVLNEAVVGQGFPGLVLVTVAGGEKAARAAGSSKRGVWARWMIQCSGCSLCRDLRKRWASLP